MKKTIILKESELVELIESTVTDIQEQTLYTNSLDFQYFDTDKENLKTYNRCSEYREQAERVAQKIVNMEFEAFTEDDLRFYNQYANSSVSCNWSGSKTVDEYIVWIAEGRPGMCDKWWHCVLPVFEIAALFIPVVGIYVSLGIGMIDAALYYNEGDKQTAGLVAFLTIERPRIHQALPSNLVHYVLRVALE